MSYRIKEAFYSLQGEGARAGRAAVFCRFAGCNLWSGCEADRSRAICKICDTDFLGTDGEGGGVFETAETLADHLARFWPVDGGGKPYLVFTGGEPSLQLDAALVRAAKARGFETAVETNGARLLPDGLDWITVSPKPGAPLVVTAGDELKLLHPSAIAPENVAHLNFRRFFLQPLDDADRQGNAQAALAYCLAHPQWRLSLQIHKILGVK